MYSIHKPPSGLAIVNAFFVTPSCRDIQPKVKWPHLCIHRWNFTYPAETPTVTQRHHVPPEYHKSYPPNYCSFRMIQRKSRATNLAQIQDVFLISLDFGKFPGNLFHITLPHKGNSSVLNNFERAYRSMDSRNGEKWVCNLSKLLVNLITRYENLLCPVSHLLQSGVNFQKLVIWLSKVNRWVSSYGFCMVCKRKDVLKSPFLNPRFQKRLRASKLTKDI